MKFLISTCILFLFIINGYHKANSQPVVYEPYFERLYPFQPNVDLGGQAISLSVNPSNDNEVLAVTKTGGIMKTSDRGRNWRTLFGLPTHWVTYVRHAPMNPRLIIATTRHWDYNYTGQGGVWISRDGGETWVRPAITNPPTARVEAYCIATYPGSSKIMVGTNLGLATSENNGETWTYQVVPGTSVGAVALMRGNAMIISTSSGIYLWNGFSRSWQQESTGIGTAFGPNSFCVPYQFMNNAESVSPIFVTTWSEQIQFSNNGGLNWTIVDTIPAAINYAAGGTFFVKAAKNWYNDGFDLFCSNEWGIYRKHCPRTGSNFSVRFNERWNYIPFRHSDISDLSLDRTNEAYLMASDGGVQRYWRDIAGDNFSFDDGGGKSSNGFHGLEITEIQGVYIASRRQHDLYFATQHNNLWGSENAGTSWPGVDGAEGFLIEAPRVAATENEVKLGYVTCADCFNKISNRLFRDVRYLIPSAPGGSSCLKYLKPNSYLTFAEERLTTPGSVPYSTKYFLTENYTRPDISPSTLTQSQLFNVNYLVPRGLPKSSGVPESHILYQAYKDYRGRFLTDSIVGIDMGSGPDDQNIQRVKLMRMYINFNRGGGVFASDQRFAAMRNFGSIGVFPTEFAWYEQFAPDPIYPNHLIAADAINRQMMQSFNGGDDWDSMPALTRLITNRGAKRFTQGRLTNTSCISFNPDYPQMMMIGTRESGLFFSWNNGRDWQAIPGSDVIPEISSIFWQNNNTAIVSSYGRGLYKINFMFRPARVRLADLLLNPVYTFIRPDIAPLMSSANLPDSFRQYFDAAYMVTEGSIEELTVKNGQVIRIALTSNSSRLLYTDEKNFKQSFETVDWDPASMKAGFSGMEKLISLKEKGYNITGLLFNKGKLVDVIYSKEPLGWPIKTAFKELQPTGEKELKIEGKRFMFANSSSSVNGYSYIGKDRKLRIEGMNFPTDLPAPYKVLIDGRAVKTIKDFYPQKDGSFSFDIDLSGIKYGCHTITVYQYNKQKQRISETDEFIIPNGDEWDEKINDKK
jgi:hypothetical protein